VDVVNRTSIADLTNYLPNGEWTLMQPPKLVRRVKYYPCCPDLPFPEIFITLQIRRKTLYYM
jgi:nicotinic acetylcholine receptor